MKFPAHTTKLNLIQLTQLFMKAVHEGQRFKYVDGPYYVHPLDVAARMGSTEEEVVALLHDTVEEIRDARFGKRDISSAREEKAIKRILHLMDVNFKACGFDISHLLPHVDILTKRRYEKDYDTYVQKVIDYCKKTNSLITVKVKKADLRDNSHPERNRPLSLQGSKDRLRLLRYMMALQKIDAAFPEKDFPEMRLRKITVRKFRRPGGPKPDRRRGKAERMRWAHEDPH